MAKSDEPEITIRVIIFRDSDCDVWVAQGLEYDICAQAPTIDAVHLAFQTTLASTLKLNTDEGKQPLAGLGEAPRHFFEMYERSVIKTRLERHEPSRREIRRTGAPTPLYKVTEKLAAAVA